VSTIAIRGFGSEIVRGLIPLLPAGEELISVPRDGAMPAAADRYLFCAGFLAGEHIHQLSSAERQATMEVNFLSVVADCETILAKNPDARICIIGSESGFSGSFDAAYAGSKAAIHTYVETKPLSPGQQLVAVAPSIISDAGMTLRRDDRALLDQRAATHPKRRFLLAREVAALVHFLLYVDEGYLSGTVIRMHGGSRR
jgi:NAD(P)-dependent dehydrogenase (short-subunit alcohol dehydrogenase family)